MRAGKSLSVSSADIRRLKALVVTATRGRSTYGGPRSCCLRPMALARTRSCGEPASRRPAYGVGKNALSRRGSTGCSRQNASLAHPTARRRGRGARCRADAWRTAGRDDPLDRRLDGEGGGPQRQLGSTHLAQAWPPAAPHAPVRTERCAFVDKLRDVVGLDVDPPAYAMSCRSKKRASVGSHVGLRIRSNKIND